MDLQAIEARLEAAPEPEKWQVEEGWEGYRVFYKDDGPGDLPIAEEICQGTDSGEALAEFIAHAPKDIRALIDEVTELREQIAQEIEVHMRRHDNAQIGFSAVGDAYADAARIARGKTGKVKRCLQCGCDLRYPTAVHIVDCGPRKEQD